ncbi:MAG: hypothetical protein ACMXYD_05180 [Candidatus Woesearchaeota archaeon]
MTHHHHTAVGGINGVNLKGNNALAREAREKEYSGKDVFDFFVKARYYRSDLEDMLFTQGDVVAGESLLDARDFFVSQQVKHISETYFAGKTDIIRSSTGDGRNSTIEFIDESVLYVHSRIK